MCVLSMFHCLYTLSSLYLDCLLKVKQLAILYSENLENGLHQQNILYFGLFLLFIFN